MADNVRYAVEQEILPMLLYEKKDEFIAVMAMDGARLVSDMMNNIAHESGEERQTKPEDYKVSPAEASNDVRLICITMPRPEEPLLSTRCYIAFDREMKKIAYFMVERGTGGEYYLCGRNEKKEHVNYGETPGDAVFEIKRIGELFAQNA